MTADIVERLESRLCVPGCCCSYCEDRREAAAEIRRLREALTFYANASWDDLEGDTWWQAGNLRPGSLARAALAPSPAEGDQTP